MKITILPTYEQISQEIAEKIISIIHNKPNALICIAGGETPKGIFTYLVQAEKNKQVDFSSCHFVSLDEWVGLGIETRGSCIETLYSEFFNHISILEKNIAFFNGKNKDLQQECQSIENFITDKGGLDCIVLGIGMNGHIGFNEPGIDPEQYSIIVPLDLITKEVSAKYFNIPLAVEYGISLGMKTILASKEIILMANGTKKASIVYSTVKDPISIKNPATLLRQVSNLAFYLDQKAASNL